MKGKKRGRIFISSEDLKRMIKETGKIYEYAGSEKEIPVDEIDILYIKPNNDMDFFEVFYYHPDLPDTVHGGVMRYSRIKWNEE